MPGRNEGQQTKGKEGADGLGDSLLQMSDIRSHSHLPLSWQAVGRSQVFYFLTLSTLSYLLFKREEINILIFAAHLLCRSTLQLSLHATIL